MSFLGPKPTQDPMNNVFEQKNFEEKNFGPPGPPTEKKFGPGLGRPGRAGGGPKGGQNRSVGVSNPSKTVGHPQNMFDTKYYVEIFCLAKVMPKTRFFGLRWGVFGPFWARRPYITM